jgi:hypothetical protein
MRGERSRPETARTGIAQIAGDVAGAAAHVADVSFAFDPGGEAGEQFAIEWLVLELGIDVAGVFVRDAIVAFLNRAKGLLVHTVFIDSRRAADVQGEKKARAATVNARPALRSELYL